MSKELNELEKVINIRNENIYRLLPQLLPLLEQRKHVSLHLQPKPNGDLTALEEIKYINKLIYDLLSLEL